MKRIFLLFIMAFILFSCARVGSPVGGPKDSLAPVVMGSNIDSSRVNVPRNIKEFRIDFDEYVTLKEIQKNLIISPPIKYTKILPSNLATKFFSIQWEDSLQANTTYNFNFGNSIQDNNEGNVLPYYNFAFSTGEKLDSLYISGDVFEALQIKKQADSKVSNVVGLYQVKDSMNFREKPYYIARVDDDGYFELNYLAPGNYELIAFQDENGNSVYDSGKEKVGFLKQPLKFDSIISGMKIDLYPSKKPIDDKEIKEAEGGILFVMEGNPKSIEIKSLQEKLQDFKVTHQPYSDSLRIWFDAKKSNVGIENSENLKFSYKTETKSDTVSLFYKKNQKDEMQISNNSGNLLPPQSEFKFSSNYAVSKIQPEKWTLKIDSLVDVSFSARISETHPYDVFVKANFEEGKKYQLTVPKGSVSSFYEDIVVGKRFDFEADKVQNYGSITLNLANAPTAPFWVQVLDNSEKTAYQKLTKDSEIKFNFVKPGEYYVKILVDKNENGFWDPANFETRTFAEPAYLFYKIINVRSLWEMNEDWDLNDKRRLDPTLKSSPKPTSSPQQNPQSPSRNLNNEGILTPSNKRILTR